MNLRVKELELVLSERLIKILKKINHQIADDLLNVHQNYNDSNYKMSFIDKCHEPDKISFIQCNKIPDLIENDIIHGDYVRNRNSDNLWGTDNKEDICGYYKFIEMYKNDWISDKNHTLILHENQFKSDNHDVWKKNRSEMKVGRFINRMFPNKYPSGSTRSNLSKQEKANDVESFVNQFIAVVEEHSKKIDIVSGDKITYWYDIENYLDSSGSLGGSCMSYSNKSTYMDLYAKNPDNVSMLILYPEGRTDKIIGRALLWNVKVDGEEDRQFMDRIYTSNESDEYLFMNYAKANNYLYKSNQTYGYEIDIVDGDDTRQISLKVKLDNCEHDNYPYLDTLQYLNFDTGIITNDYDNIDTSEFVCLTSDEGEYHDD